MHRAKVHHFCSRIAIPAPNRVNLASGRRVKCLTFALRGATLRPWPRDRQFTHNPLILIVVAQIWAQPRTSFRPWARETPCITPVFRVVRYFQIGLKSALNPKRRVSASISAMIVSTISENCSRIGPTGSPPTKSIFPNAT